MLKQLDPHSAYVTDSNSNLGYTSESDKVNQGSGLKEVKDIYEQDGFEKLHNSVYVKVIKGVKNKTHNIGILKIRSFMEELTLDNQDISRAILKRLKILNN